MKKFILFLSIILTSINAFSQNFTGHQVIGNSLRTLSSTIFTNGDGLATHQGGMSFRTFNNGSTFVITPTNQIGSFVNSTIRFGGFGSFNNNIVNLAVSGRLLVGTPSSAANFHFVVPPSSDVIEGMIVDVNDFLTPSNELASHYFRVRNNSGNFTVFGIRGNNNAYFNGTVSIGTSCVNDAKLAVKGKIYAEGVVVKLTNQNGCFPDYVFDKEYRLRSLEEVKSYIEENHHLPEVPSAEEVEEKGMDMAEMNMILLKKVEELTLYIIKLDEKIHQLQKDKQ